MTIEKPKRRPPNAGKGRPKGSPNRLTADLREMLQQALHDAGGVAFLRRCLESSEPRVQCAALALLGKLIPSEAPQQQLVVTWEP